MLINIRISHWNKVPGGRTRQIGEHDATLQEANEHVGYIKKVMKYYLT